MSPLRALLLVATLAAGLPWLTGACSCAPPAPPLEAANASDLVVFGNVTDVAACEDCPDPFSPLNVKIDVLLGFVGAEDGDKVAVTTPSQSSACGVSFGVNQTWIVYATGGQASLCSRTRRAAADDPELEELAMLRR